MTAGAGGSVGFLPSAPFFTYTNAHRTLPLASTTMSSIRGGSAYIAAHFGSASILIFLRFLVSPLTFTVPEMDAPLTGVSAPASILEPPHRPNTAMADRIQEILNVRMESPPIYLAEELFALNLPKFSMYSTAACTPSF